MRSFNILLIFLALPMMVQAQVGIITTYAGGVGVYSGDGGPAVGAGFGQICQIRFDKDNNLYITEAADRIRKVSVDGIINTTVGTSVQGFTGDGGPAISATFAFSISGYIALDQQGNMYIADYGNHRIRKVNASDNIVTTIAGTGVSGFSGDGGPATAAMLSMPTSIAVGRNGTIYFSEQGNRRIRKIDTSGIITTIAGTGVVGSSGDGGPALNAKIRGLRGMIVDYANNLILAEDVKVRKIDLSTGIITKIAGTGVAGYNGDGIPAVDAQLNGAWDVAADVQGNIYIPEFFSSRIRKIDAAGTIHTIAGTGVQGYNGDNIPATTAQLNHIVSVAVDSCGQVYISDQSSDRIRKVTYPGCRNLNVLIEPSMDSFSIHPNPVTSQLTITSNTKIKQVTITDVTGRAVLRGAETTIDVSGLISGVYFVRVSDVSGNIKIEKIIKR